MRPVVAVDVGGVATATVKWPVDGVGPPSVDCGGGVAVARVVHLLICEHALVRASASPAVPTSSRQVNAVMAVAALAVRPRGRVAFCMRLTSEARLPARWREGRVPPRPL